MATLMWIAAADSRPKSVGLVQGLAATWHSLSESGELSKWFWPSWQQHKHRRGVVFTPHRVLGVQRCDLLRHM